MHLGRARITKPVLIKSTRFRVAVCLAIQTNVLLLLVKTKERVLMALMILRANAHAVTRAPFARLVKASLGLVLLNRIFSLCAVILCPVLSAVEPLSVSIGLRTVGTLARFSCAPGFILRAVSILYCTEGGKWSNSIPNCERN